MRKYLLPPVAALVFGAAGLGLRLWGLKTAFEWGTGLPIPGTPATPSLIALTVAALLLLGGLLWRMCHRAPNLDYDAAFYFPNPAAVTADVLCAFLLLGASLLGLWEFWNSFQRNLAYPILSLLLLGAGICVLLVGRDSYRGRFRGRYRGGLLLPPYAFCLWLILSYQAQAGNPVLLDYVYRLLAIICALLGLYFIAGFSFEKGKPLPTLCFGLAAVYFSCVSLAGLRSWINLALYLFCIIYFTAHSVVLLHNLTAQRED